MLLIESIYSGDTPPDGELVLDFDARTKSRLRTRLTDGEEVGLFLPRGTILRGGTQLLAKNGRVITVVAAPESLVEARCANTHELARAAYHLGNRHVAVQVCEGALRIQRDHVLEHMLQGLGAKLVPVEAPFEPEAGAYAPGHQHAERGATEARIHVMGAA